MPAKLISSNLEFDPHSLVIHQGVEYGLARTDRGSRLAVLAGSDLAALEAFDGECSELGGRTLFTGGLNPQNAAALRRQLSWLAPRPLGLRTTAGMGDRLGLATPGHVRALRAIGGSIAPIFAQQSIREMKRTGRTPQQVMDDATWGMFAEGWRDVAGADADHLQTPADIDVCLAAGFTFFTIDPGAHVDNRAEHASLGALRRMADDLPASMSPSATGLAGKKVKFDNLSLHFDEATLLKAAVKYGRALDHVVSMYRHLVSLAGSRPFELEISVDETEHPTTHAEHFYLASEMKRLGLSWASLAPRYVGRFEKGVDYISPSGDIGDIADLKSDLAGHAAIARRLGPYKLGIHSGSDKFSIYPLAVRETGGMLHLKTAGTSYLEALRTVAAVAPDFFEEIYRFARERYPADKASYHTSADLRRATPPEDVKHWPDLLEHFDARQILHVTYGSVLTEQDAQGRRRFSDRLMALLRAHSEAYVANLQKHFERHLRLLLAQE